MGVLAAALAGWAVWWWFPSGRDGLARLAVRPPTTRTAPAPAPAVTWALAAAGLLVAAALWGGPGAAALALAAVQVAAVCMLVWGRRRRRRVCGARRAEVVHAGELVAGLLRVGRVPSAALLEAATDAPVLAVAAAELRAGGEASGALRRSSGEPGREGLADLAAAWEVSVRTGASLVEAFDAASARLAADADVARVVEAELSAARMAGRIMAVLPLAGLALGYGLGGNPLAFLLASPIGWLCLDIGVGLACLGVVWLDTIAQGAGGR